MCFAARRTEVVYRPDAIEGLRVVYEYIAVSSGNPLLARCIVERILIRGDKIGDAPGGGRPRNDVLPGLRTVPFERKAVIAYIVTSAVAITTIFYGGRDCEVLYRSSSDVDREA